MAIKNLLKVKMKHLLLYQKTEQYNLNIPH